ncbi:MAG TPA: hypothetical protein VIF83_02775 [Gemmatimonadaceae bacterium]
MISHSIKALSLTMIAAILACDASPTAPGDERLNPLNESSTQGSVLAEIRAATAQFHDVNAAIAAGYVRATPCIQSTVGGEGIRYRNPALFDAVIDLRQPEILIYEPMKNGDLRLVAVQYLVASALWDAAHSSPPSLGDQPFMDRRSPPFGAAFPNYSLVVWAWAHNPSGMYVLQNPAVSCEFADL